MALYLIGTCVGLFDDICTMCLLREKRHGFADAAHQVTPEAGPSALQLEAQKEMERLNGELSNLTAANKQFEKAHKDLEAAQRALETRASGSESALKQAQTKLKSAEDAAAAGQKLLESVRRCQCLYSKT